MPRCYICGEEVRTGTSFRFRLGAVVYQKKGSIFVEESFGEPEGVKYRHVNCGSRIYPQFLKPGVCTLCGQQYFPEEAVLFIEEGLLQVSRYGHKFDGRSGGAAHYICAEEDLDLGLWRA